MTPMHDPKTGKPGSAATDDGRPDAGEAKPDYIVEDRDAMSRTVENTAITADVKPDVDVNCRPEIMGDEGPIAAANPYNKDA